MGTYPEGTSYDKTLADAQKAAFFAYMSLQGKMLYERIKLSIAYKKTSAPAA